MRLDAIYERVTRLELPNARVLQRWCSPASSFICCDDGSGSSVPPDPSPGGTGVYCGQLGELPAQIFVTIAGLNNECNGGRRFVFPDAAPTTDPSFQTIDYLRGQVTFAPFDNRSYRLKYGGQSFPSGVFNNIIPPGHFYYLDDSVPVAAGSIDGVTVQPFPFPDPGFGDGYPLAIVTRNSQNNLIACNKMSAVSSGLGPGPFDQWLMSRTNIAYNVPCDIDIVTGNVPVGIAGNVFSSRRVYVDQYVGLPGFGPANAMFNQFGVIPSLFTNDANVISQFSYAVRYSVWKQIIGFVYESCNAIGLYFHSAIVRHETYSDPDGTEAVGLASVCQYENQGPLGFLFLGNCDYTRSIDTGTMEMSVVPLSLQPSGGLGGIGFINGEPGGTVEVSI